MMNDMKEWMKRKMLKARKEANIKHRYFVSKWLAFDSLEANEKVKEKAENEMLNFCAEDGYYTGIADTYEKILNKLKQKGEL